MEILKRHFIFSESAEVNIVFFGGRGEGKRGNFLRGKFSKKKNTRFEERREGIYIF